MKGNRIKYSEISRAEVSRSRNVVISTCSRGGFTIAQQAVVREKEYDMPVFMKGAVHVDDVTGLYNLRDALNVAIMASESGMLEDGDSIWDD